MQILERMYKVYLTNHVNVMESKLVFFQGVQCFTSYTNAKMQLQKVHKHRYCDHKTISLKPFQYMCRILIDNHCSIDR